MSNQVTKFVNDHFVDTNYHEFFTEEGMERFRTFFGRVVQGQPNVYDTPFAKGESTQDLLQSWNKVLESVSQQWPTLWDFEQDMRSKVGPLSVMKPLEDRLEDIAHYYWDVNPSRIKAIPLDERAINATKMEFRSIVGLRPRAQDRTVDLMKKSTNSGGPFWAKRRDVLKDTSPCEVWGYPYSYYSRNDVYQQLPGNKVYECGAVVGWRGQEGGPVKSDVKQRVVWMFPFAVNIRELQVYQPLIEACQKRRLVPAWVSMDLVDEEITKLFDSKSSKDLVITTDFSKFDQHFNVCMQDGAKSMLTHLMKGASHAGSWLNDVFPIKYNIPLIWQMPDDRGVISAFHGFHGMASGSGGTNADETLAHRILQHEAAILHGEQLNLHSMCLGDDGILTYPGIKLDDVIDTYQSHGQECNESKQYVSTQDCVYLRRWHHTNYRQSGICVGVYSTNRALGRLRYLERFMDPKVWDEKMVALRQLSILENVKYHPLNQRFVDFCMKRDKYRLGIDIPGFLDNLPQLAKEATDYMPDFLGYTKTLQGFRPSGISEWWIVKYLKSLR